MEKIEKELKPLLEQFDCDYNLLYADVRQVLRQKNILRDKVVIYGISSKELKQEILKLQEIIVHMKNNMEERWINLEHITSAMLKVLNDR